MTALLSEPRQPRAQASKPTPLLRFVPSTEPPYDDERPEHERTWPPRARSGWEQLSLLTRSDLEVAILAEPAFPELQPLVPEPMPVGDCFDQEGEREPNPDGLEPIGAVAPRYVRAFLEVLAGQRQARQLAKVATPEVLDELDQRGADLDVVWAPTLRSVRVCEPVPGVAEVSAVVANADRLQALAMRLSGFGGLWVITYASIVQ